jgi:HEPN domain-containing protein
MTKQEHIAYWIRTAEEDWTVVDILFEKSKYLYCLFYAHLAVEKILKANWVKNSDENYPPKIHNLVKIVQLANIELPDDDVDFLFNFNDFQLEGRYPDYLFRTEKRCNESFTKKILESARRIYKCLHANL